MRTLLFCQAFLSVFFAESQTAWPSQTWAQATNLTSVMGGNGIPELSGLHWNPLNNRLYTASDDGEIRILQLNTATNTLTQVAVKAVTGGPEGITQADYIANEFFVIAEDTYEIRKYTYNADLTNITQSKHWNLLAAPSPMTDTGNTGPEGIVFVPDSFLTSIGFISQQSGNLYTSVKGMGGLIFIAHQDGGYIWVFDINPNTNNDFAYVGKYKTSETESCDLAFDRSTGLLYILHNISGANRLEVTDLSSSIVNGDQKLTSVNEYFIPNPGGSNDNIEGFALTPKCDSDIGSYAWLCRDVSSGDSTALQQDALRRFGPFTADGSCVPLGVAENQPADSLEIFVNLTSKILEISTHDSGPKILSILNVNGQSVMQKQISGENAQIDISSISPGVYFAEIKNSSKVRRTKFVKN